MMTASAPDPVPAMAMATATASPVPSSRRASLAAARDMSHTPGPTIVQPQPPETVPNGVYVNNVDVDDKEATSHTATPATELARTPSRTPPSLTSAPPPSAQPPSAQPPSTLPPPMQPLPAQPPSAMPFSEQQMSTQPLLARSPSAGLPLAELPSTQPPPAQMPLMHSQVVEPSVPSGATQPGMPHYVQKYRHKFYRFAPSNTASPLNAVPPSEPPPPPSQQAREMSGVLKRFPSPEVDYENQIPGFARDLSLLADTIQRSCPEAVRRVVRDRWEKCIMGSEFHHAFVLNAIIHHASGVIMRRAVRDFGRKMVAEAKEEITGHLGPQDLDDIAPLIFEKCSEQFLDRALEHRLKTIDARSLINALARAERLGYTNSDVLENRQENRQERVVPTAQMHSPEVAYINPVTSSQTQQPPAAPIPAMLPFQSAQNAPPSTDLKCRLCWKEFKHTKPYEYHVAKQLCTKPASEVEHHAWWCDTCGAGFTTKSGQQYHTANAVCGVHTTAAATPRPQATTPKSEVPPPINYAHHPVAVAVTQLPPNPPQPYATPNRLNVNFTGTPSSSQDDPYGHLTPQQRNELDEELRQAEINYAPRFREAEGIPEPLARKNKLESLQNTFSTKQSMIRKKYGVRLRVRRTRAEIDEEKSRLGRKHGLSSPNGMASTPSVKRQRSDGASNSIGGPSYVSHSPQIYAPIPPATNHLSISQMNNSGLGGSAATAATTDPTVPLTSTQLPSTEPKPAQNSLSSLQRKGYRVSSHVGQTSRPISASPAPRRGSAATPVVLDDDSTDTEEDIPATLPPRKVS